MFVIRKIWRALLSWNTRLEIQPFALLPTILLGRDLKIMQNYWLIIANQADSEKAWKVCLFETAGLILYRIRQTLWSLLKVYKTDLVKPD